VWDRNYWVEFEGGRGGVHLNFNVSEVWEMGSSRRKERPMKVGNYTLADWATGGTKERAFERGKSRNSATEDNITIKFSKYETMNGK